MRGKVKIRDRWGFVLGMVGTLAVLGGCSSALRESKVVAVASPRPEAPAPVYPSGPGMRPYRINGQWYYPLAHARGYKQRGIASWYGIDFHGRPTACGEIYNMHGISAAHKTLPLGTRVRVNNLQNGRSLDLRINDRGPFIPGRIIDLSFGAAMKLGVAEPGTAPVEVIALSEPSRNVMIAKYVASEPAGYAPGHFAIQVGAFETRENAEKLVQKLKTAYPHAQVKPTLSHRGNQTLYRVLVGKCATLDAAEAKAAVLKSRGFHDVFTIAEQ